MIKKNKLSNIIDKTFYGYGEFYIRLLYFLQKSDLKICEVPVKYAPRKFGESKSKLLKMLFLYSFHAIKITLKS